MKGVFRAREVDLAHENVFGDGGVLTGSGGCWAWGCC